MHVYYVTLRHVRVTTIAVEKEYALHNVCVCVCNLSYPACKAHAPCYTVICVLSSSTIFFHII